MQFVKQNTVKFRSSEASVHIFIVSFASNVLKTKENMESSNFLIFSFFFWFMKRSFARNSICLLLFSDAIQRDEFNDANFMAF